MPRSTEQSELSAGISRFTIWISSIAATITLGIGSYIAVQFIEFRTKVESQYTAIDVKLEYIAKNLESNVAVTEDNTKRIYALSNKYDILLTELNQQSKVQSNAKP